MNLKQKLFFFWFFILLSSFNDGLSFNDNHIVEKKNNSNVVFINSIDDLFELAEKDSLFLTDLNTSQTTFTLKIDDIAVGGTRSGEFIPMSYTGYGYFWCPEGVGQYVSHKNYNLVLSDEVANESGLNPNYVYTCWLWGAQLNVGYPEDGLIPALDCSSPKCGFAPDSGLRDTPRGYKAQLIVNENGQHILAMWTVIMEVVGRSGYTYPCRDIWIPCRKEDIIWNYGMYWK